MSESSWIKNDESALPIAKRRSGLITAAGIILLVSLITFLVINAMQGNTQLYKTVDEFYAEQSRLIGRDLRVAGIVEGDSIQFIQIDAVTSRLEFDIVDNLENPTARLHVIAINEPRPDLLQHEAQALVEGQADEKGEFIVNPGGLLLKCPTRYEDENAATMP